MNNKGTHMADTFSSIEQYRGHFLHGRRHGARDLAKRTMRGISPTNRARAHGSRPTKRFPTGTFRKALTTFGPFLLNTVRR